MKHIKSYESIEDNITFKKYVVWKLTNRVVILKNITGTNDGSYNFKRMFRYDKDDTKVYPMTEDYFDFSNDVLKKNVVYDSDDINDCLDIELLNSLFSLNKYNI